MCGRFTHLYTWAQLHKLMTLTSPPVELPARFNVAPSQPAPVVRADDAGPRSLVMLRWGLIPAWAKDPSIAGSLINARAETVAAKPAFRAAFKRRRCVVPVSGFYEWQRVPEPEAGLFGAAPGTHPPKRPHYITLADHEPMLLAGLWELWRDPASDPHADPVQTFTILTTQPNPMVARLHDRMPVVLDPADARRWLDPAADPGMLAALLKPYPAELMLARPVSTRVNSPRNDDPGCIQPV